MQPQRAPAPPIEPADAILLTGVGGGHNLLRTLRPLDLPLTDCGSIRRAQALILRGMPCMIVVDGHEALDMGALRVLRRAYDGPLVVVGTAGAHLEETLLLELGVDDVVPAHASTRLVVARIKNLLARHAVLAPPPGPELLRSGGITLDRRRRCAMLRGQVIELTGVELDLLWRLVERAGNPVPRAELAGHLQNPAASATSRSLDVHICRTRKKLEAADFDGRRLRAVRGVGYKFIA